MNLSIKTIAVIAGTFQEYTTHVKRDLIPILEAYHGVKFKPAQGDTGFEAAGQFRIFHLKDPHQLKGLGNYQLVKCGKFYEHPRLKEIEDIYKREVERRMK